MRRRMSDEMIEIAGTVDDPMNFDLQATYDVEDKVGVNNQDTVSVLAKSRMTRYSTKKWMMLKPSNIFIEFVHKTESSGRTVLRYEIADGKKVVLRNRQKTKCVLTGHERDGGVYPSFACALYPSFLPPTEPEQLQAFQRDQLEP